LHFTQHLARGNKFETDKSWGKALNGTLGCAGGKQIGANCRASQANWKSRDLGQSDRENWVEAAGLMGRGSITAKPDPLHE